MPPSRRPQRSPKPSSGPTRRRALHLGAVALAGPLAGCASGLLGEESNQRDSTEDGTTKVTTENNPTTEIPEETTLPMGVDSSLPEGSVEWPEGPKSRPERPTPLTAESAREYVHTFEYRYVYNRLHYDESTEVHEECGVESVAEYGEGFRVVVWCSAYSNTERDGETMHADYFTQYATYFVGPDSTVRREGRAGTRE